MHLVSLERLSDFDLFGIYRGQEALARRHLSAGLDSRNVVELVLGEYFSRALRRLLLEAVIAGQRHLFIAIHPIVARRIAAACLNRPRLGRGEAWLDPPLTFDTSRCAEINLHAHIPSRWLEACERTGECGAALAGRLVAMVLQRTAEGYCRHSLVLPEDAVLHIAAYLSRAGRPSAGNAS